MTAFSLYLDSFREQNVELTLPKIPKYDKLSFKRSEALTSSSSPHLASQLPFSEGDAFHTVATLQKRKRSEDGKEVFIIALEAEDELQREYQPGDTIGILPENAPDNVNEILEQLGWLQSADFPIELENNDNKRKYLPIFTTVRDLFSKYVNLRAIPMKLNLLTLAQYASDELEKKKLQYLASKQGSELYTSVILEAGTSFLQLFRNCPSCKPPAEVVVQLLPRLLPRPYSVASSPLCSPSRITVALSVLPEEREGVCTGMLRRAFTDSQQMQLEIYLRKSNGFRLPADGEAPLVLVGPGTGVAPFIGFLDHLLHTNVPRRVYLFTGFRTEQEMVFREELEAHLANGTLTQLFISYSRQEGREKKYVQDLIKENWQQVGKAIHDHGIIYECGDFKKMAESVSEALTTAIQRYLDVDKLAAAIKLKEMKANKRYIQDIWS